MTDRVTWVCAKCGDPDIYSDWECQWNNELQLWVGKNQHTGLKEIAQLAIKKQEATQC
jgi:hypothetical protein